MNKKVFSVMLLVLFMTMSFSVSASAMRVARPGPGSGGGGGTVVIDPNVTPGGEPITGNRYALVIGISDYYGDSSDLTYADDDAIDWKNYLEGVGYQVTMLLDGQATEANIVAALQNLAAMEQAGDGIVITYSGHGSYDRRSGVSMLVTWELTGFTHLEMKAITDTFDSQHVYFFDDACNQGTFAYLAQPGWVLAIGSSTSTYTYDGTADMANGIFTYYMMEGLYQPIYIVEDASNYAINLFEAATPGDATLYDYYTGDFYF